MKWMPQILSLFRDGTARQITEDSHLCLVTQRSAEGLPARGKPISKADAEKMMLAAAERGAPPPDIIETRKPLSHYVTHGSTAIH